MAADKKMHRAAASAMETVKKLDMVARGNSILISVSGGPDSVFLTHILLMLKSHFRLELYGFSLDHCTRDGRSGKDVEFVARMYRDLGIKLFTRKVDAGRWSRERKLSFQEGARKLRAGLLRELAQENNIDRIALGHNLDDNIETFLMRIIRGSGARGLAGIRPVSGKIIRPLIITSRHDIEDYLRVNHIDFCVDSSNLEDRYTRNRIRNRLIPFIRENFHGDISTSIKRAIDILGPEDDYLRDIATEVLKEIAFFQRVREQKKVIYIKLPVKSAGKYHQALKRRMVQVALELLSGNLKDMSYKNIEDIMDLMGTGGGESRQLDLPGQIMVSKISGDIHMAHTGFVEDLDAGIRSYIRERTVEGAAGEVSGKKVIKIGEKTGLSDFGFFVVSEMVSDPGDYNNLPDSKAIMDFGKVIPPITVRRWREGDRFYPLGMEGSKKLQDFFTDCRIPVNLRKKIPVFCDREKIIWVGNMRMDDRVRLTSSSGEFLMLELFEK